MLRIEPRRPVARLGEKMMAHQQPTIGALVRVSAPDPLVFGGEEAVAIVSRVNGDATINAHVFHPTRPAAFFTGLQHIEDREALEPDDPNRNLAAWFWPPTQEHP